ncbi:MAG: TonB-dependent receptor [Bacteroidetes bacterium]|nr:TonB-dependent receptor [Bacteroidota bacterium]
MKYTITLPYKICVFLALLSPFACISQCAIKGNVVDTTQAAIPYTPVGLLNSKDSSVYKGAVTDQNGNYCFENIHTGEYILKISAVGYNTFYSTKIEFDSIHLINMPVFSLSSGNTNLKTVDVVAFKPTVEFKKGIIVLNVENNLIAKGNSVLDLLKQVPGVNVDAQNNVTVNGMGGVRFLMDGRLQQMSDAQMATILSGMSAETITSIELIKNPPAKYDASGTAGLINIVTKKARLKGINGSIDQSYSQGKAGRSFTTLTLNFKNNKLSAFSNLSYGYFNMYDLTELDRILSTTGSTTAFNASGHVSSLQKSANFNGGIEYELSPKTIIGLYFNDNINSSNSVQKATTTVLEGNAFNYNSFSYRSDQKQYYTSPNVNFNILHKLDTLGSQLQLSSDYVNVAGNDNKFVANHFYDLANAEILSPTNYATNTKSDYNIFYQKLDYTKMCKKDFSIEAGLKGSFININSDADYTLHNSTGDTALQNNYIYKERVLAAYTTLSKTYKKVGATIGLRAEQTDISGRNKITGFMLNRSYLNFFPSSSLDYKINEKNTLTGAYSYRIDRPGFNRMNPARVYNDELNYTVGNPTIKPQYTHDITMDYNYNSFVTVSFDYYRTRDFMYWYTYTKPQSKINIDTTFNYRLRDNYSLSVFVQKQIKWFNFQLYGSVMYYDFKGTIDGEIANSATKQFYGALKVEFLLPKNFKIQANGYYATPFYDAIQRYAPVSSINLVISKSLLKNKLDVTLGFMDIFYSENQSMSSKLPDQYYYYFQRGDTQRVRLSLSYKFGKMQIEQKLKQEGTDNRFKK